MDVARFFAAKGRRAIEMMCSAGFRATTLLLTATRLSRNDDMLQSWN
jgi:hypothetical protein